ncbi:periplasmic chaperone for outer membrane proteins Skp [Hymenobacter roseosalivarius DSM 11622]|uniref:Periplasmic chaperone for outer membrane proteins Skp n=1 Tax=Hymenobacter roseosalivarius DSM 11622 TaxID=645990 RepID=A0A1W1UZL8_9BACT|nr:OmpH family outer membrane protein [Hymenobacter roseosalivarius]SMB86547.1 periplasmic chaperone for outer membrane proteins Skp [Hymenobacter roseosalivarius DSM 11622]
MTTMNKIRLALAAAALTFTTTTATLAQAPLKIGYTSVDYVLSQMPESKQIESDLKAYSSQLEAQLKSKIADYQTKAEAYQKGASAMTEVVRADKEKELTGLQGSIQEFQRSADNSLQQKQQTLLKPALDKLQKTIDAVATENGYTYVLNSDGASPVLLHGPKEGDISDMILKKMGVTPGAAQAPAAAPAKTTPAAPTAAPAGNTAKKGKKK